MTHVSVGNHVTRRTPLSQLYWFTTYNTDRAGNAADGRPAPANPEEAKADALASVAGWGGGVEAAIERTDVADITRNRIADRCGMALDCLARQGLFVRLALTGDVEQENLWAHCARSMTVGQRPPNSFPSCQLEASWQSVHAAPCSCHFCDMRGSAYAGELCLGGRCRGPRWGQAA